METAIQSKIFKKNIFIHLSQCAKRILNPSAKIESILFVPENLTFSEYLRCLNFPLWTFWPAKTKQVKESDLF